MAGEREPGLIAGGNYLPPRSGVAPMVRERPETQTEALDRLAREREAEQVQRQADHDAKVTADAERLARIRAEMRERVEAEVGTFHLVLALGAATWTVTIPPTIDAVLRDEVETRLVDIIRASIRYQASAAAAVGWPAVTRFAHEAESWRVEAARMLGELQGVGLARFEAAS